MVSVFMTVNLARSLPCVLLVSCGSPQHSASSSGSPPPATTQIALDNANLATAVQDDKVGRDAPEPDHHPDLHLVAHVGGEISALILTICEDATTQTGTQWDTIVGQDPIPDGFEYRRGEQTGVLGVFDEHGQRLNCSNGSLPTMAFAPNSVLNLYVAMRDTVVAGRSVCLTAVQPNGALAHATAELQGSDLP